MATSAIGLFGDLGCKLPLVLNIIDHPGFLSPVKLHRLEGGPDLREQARQAAVPWIDAVLEAWGGAQVESAAVTAPLAIQRLRTERSPAAIARLLRDLWPRPLEAAVYLQMPLRPSL